MEHYEKQTEEEAVAEDEAAFRDNTTVAVPPELVPKVVALIARYERQRATKK